MTVSVPNARVRTPRRWLHPLFLAWGTLGLPIAMQTLFVGLVSSSTRLAVPLAYFVGFVVLERAMRRWLRHESGELRADETGLTLAGKPLVVRKTLSYGHVLRTGDALLLRLVPRSKNEQPIDIEVADEAQANELLAAMYLDRTVANYTMIVGHWGAQPLYATVTIVGAFVFLVLMLKLFLAFAPHLTGPSFGIALLLVVSLPVAGVVAGAFSSEIHFSVGLDGVWLHRRLVTKRFVPFNQIASIEHVERDVTLKLVDHTTIEIHLPKSQRAEATSFVARVRAGMESAPDSSPIAAESVARNGRSVAEWIANAARTNERSATYRAPVVPHDELWRIVEDAAASPTARAGAALALRADLSAEGRARLRVAADTCAETKLRVALESVMTPDDEALAAALEPLDEPLERRFRNRDHH